MIRDAYFSRYGLYRYWLRRTWEVALPTILWVMLNPSTADAERDDMTVRKVVHFSHTWGYGACLVVNAYAFRATSPVVLRTAGYREGADNYEHIRRALSATSVTVAAWGANIQPERERLLFAQLRAYRAVDCLGVTKGGHPKHPLYLRSTTPRRDFWLSAA